MKEAARTHGPAIAAAIAVVAWDPRAPAADPKRALALALAVIALALAISRPSRDPSATAPRTPALAFSAFVAWCGVALAWGAPAGSRDLATWVAAAAIAVSAARLGLAEARLLAARAAAIAGTAAALIAAFQWLRGARGILVHGGQGNANWLGLLLAMTLPLTASLVARAGSKRARSAVILALAAQLAGLVIAHSRVAWVAAAAAALVVLADRMTRGLSRKTGAIVIAAIALAAAAPAALGARAEAPEVARVAEGEDVPAAIAFRGRAWIWRSSLDAALRAVPFGAGQGRFAEAYLEAQGARLAGLDPKAASRRFLNATTAHADWLEVLVDGGPLALALLLFTLAAGALHAVRSGFVAASASLVALAVCASGDSPLRQPGIALLLGLVLAASADPAARVASPRVARAATLGLLAASAILLAASVSAYLASRRLTAAREALPGARRALLESAARLDPSSGEIALERGLFELEEGEPEAALAALERSRALLAGVSVHVAIGNARTLLGRHEEAIDAYRAALRRSPGSLRAHANITQPLLALGRVDEADHHHRVAASLWPGNPHLAEMAEQIRRARIERLTGPPP